MPPICTESLQKSFNQEGKILVALDDIKNNCVKPMRAAAKLYNIFYSILYIYANYRVLHKDIYANLYKLTGLEEDLLIQWIFSIDLCRAVSRCSIVQ